MPPMSEVLPYKRHIYYEVPCGWREDGSVNAMYLVHSSNYFLRPELYLHPDIYCPTVHVYKCHLNVLDNSA